MIRGIVALAILLGTLNVAHAVASGTGAGPSVEHDPVVSKDARININTAGLEQLVELPGIGPTRARAIVVERQKRRFRRVEDILRVPGIGRKTFGRIRDSIRVQ